ncbi:sodium/proline symporter [candidate division WOR-3 bacterium]|nr:sodium/proline symporter [candidate division WOR-3 bacterium]
MDPILIGFFVYLIVILGIGIWTYRLTKTQEDFIIAGRRLNPVVAAFSERASGESSWLLLGLPAMVLTAGLIELWTAIGCVAGIIAAWFIIAKDLRIKTEKLNAITLPGFLSKNFGQENKINEIIATFIIIFFYSLYVSAQFNGAGKTLHTTFGIPHFNGIMIGALVILFYTLMGGFFAVAWTDFLQAILMIITLVALPIVGFITILKGGHNINFTLSSLVGNLKGWPAIAGVIGGLSWGLGYFGQPHTIVRYMSIKDPEKIRISRNIAIVWSIPAFFGAFFIGVVGKGLVTPGTLSDSEYLMPHLATTLLPLWLAGILISGAIAAMMSTADSQLLVASSALSEDVYHNLFRRKISEKTQLMASRIITLLVGISAFILAIKSQKLIYTMVSYAWCGLGASFGPALLFSLKWKKTTKYGVMAGMLTGAISTMIWANIETLDNFISVRVAAFALATIAVIVVSLLTRKK